MGYKFKCPKCNKLMDSMRERWHIDAEITVKIESSYHVTYDRSNAKYERTQEVICPNCGAVFKNKTADDFLVEYYEGGELDTRKAMSLPVKNADLFLKEAIEKLKKPGGQ